jgi:hypothetical protein
MVWGIGNRPPWTAVIVQAAPVLFEKTIEKEPRLSEPPLVISIGG